MLSVFITPWMKPTSIQRRDQRRLRVDDALEQREVRVLGLGRVGVVAGDRVVGEAPHQLGSARAPRTGTCRRAGGSPRRGSSTAPGSIGLARRPRSPVATTASARVVGMPSACIASPITYSRSIGPTAALPSPPRANGVRPEPFRCRSRRRPWTSTHLAEQQRPPVAEARRVPAELVAGVGLRDRRGALGRPRCRPGRRRRSGAASASASTPSSAASASLSASSRGAGAGAACHGSYSPSSSRT